MLVLVVPAMFAAVFVPGSAGAREPTDPQIISGPVGQFYGYLTPVMVVEKGGALTYTNIDLVQHDVVHLAEADGVYGSSKKPWCKNFAKKEVPDLLEQASGPEPDGSRRGTGRGQAGLHLHFLLHSSPGHEGNAGRSSLTLTDQAG